MKSCLHLFFVLFCLTKYVNIWLVFHCLTMLILTIEINSKATIKINKLNTKKFHNKCFVFALTFLGTWQIWFDLCVFVLASIINKLLRLIPNFFHFWLCAQCKFKLMLWEGGRVCGVQREGKICMLVIYIKFCYIL